MKKVIDIIVKIESVIAVLLIAAMLVIIFINTFGRYTGTITFSWAEEFARYCMIAATFLGIGVGASKGAHFSADILPMFVPEKGMKFFRIIIAVLVVIFAIICVWFGKDVIAWQIAAGQKTPSLRWPMWCMYTAVPIGIALFALIFCYHTYEVNAGLAVDLDEATEAAMEAEALAAEVEEGGEK